MRTRSVLLAALVVTGCDGDITYSGYNMDEYFPFDGERTWEFVSTDTSLPYKLVATLDSEYELNEAEATQIYDVTYEHICVSSAVPCEDELVRTVRWSSNRTYGSRIHGFSTAAGSTTFDPPLLFTDGQMIVGESVETVIGGTTFTSTFNGLDTCPVDWTSEWGAQCIHISLSDGDGDPTSGEYLAGEYWLITQYNLVGMQLTEDTGLWRLTYATYQ